MTGSLDVSLPGMLEQAAQFLVLPMWGAMMFLAFAQVRRGGGRVPRVLGWSALAGLMASAVAFLGRWVQEGLRALPEAHETPDGPLSYEQWDFLHAVTGGLSGCALLVAGGALFAIGWGERRRVASAARRGSGARRK